MRLIVFLDEKMIKVCELQKKLLLSMKETTKNKNHQIEEILFSRFQIQSHLLCNKAFYFKKTFKANYPLFDFLFRSVFRIQIFYFVYQNI